MRYFVALVSTAVVALTSMVTAQTPEGRLLFYRIGQPTSSIHTIKPDGTDEKNLTPLGTTGGNPIWSRDGLRIAYNRFVSSASNQIWIMNSDGTGHNLVSDEAGSLNGLRGWSPDGTKLIFTRGSDASGTTRIWTMNINGSNKVQLTEGGAGTFDRQPVWSPKGDLIAFERCSGQYCDLYTIRPDGTSELNVTPMNPLGDDTVRWSPDGKWIVYGSMHHPNAYNTVISAPDGSDLITLINGSNLESFKPSSFSPDGKLVSLAYRDVNSILSAPTGIYIARVDGLSLPTRITTGAFNPGPWSPDGSRLAYSGTKVFTIMPDGSGIIQVTHNPFGFDTVVDWKSVVVTSAGSQVIANPSSDVTVLFSDAISGGVTSAIATDPAIFPPSNFAPSSGFIFYNISSTVAFSGSVIVTVMVRDVGSADECSGLALMHYTDGSWTQAENSIPVYSASDATCKLSQTVTSLSPFAVTLRDQDLDSVLDREDNCPTTFNSEQLDFDGDGIGDACDSPGEPPRNAGQCKKDGWENWLPRFRNQGDCIQYVNTGR